MKKTSIKIYFSFFIISIILLPIFCVLLYTWLTNSNSYYINKFLDNKLLFVEAAELEVKEYNDNKFQIKQKELFDKCRVDSIDLYNFSDGKKYITFSMCDSSFYPSNEYEYRMIVYQSDNKLPDYFDRYYSIKILDNWYFVTNSYKSTQLFVLLLFVSLFILITWIVGIIKIRKKGNNLLNHTIRNCF